ncbi:aminotransferase class V-fold PLP-dependent enzyme [Clostridium sp. P21]|uniref:Aminotransferase class V-fold PLP-dependent enzyme n=1 Tax=Clostridium muellerianum TaxID=2716538 RepID=A0A7Y0EEM4_9CLOT|nr:aminotransferase class V-fold PLP-dependent enzyme [Clostridium muellerianum]NMM62017.1 aminotransferase class V-fold PLP-dependent enzyme [Clostridium muellerianum]
MNPVYFDNAATSFPKAPGVAESIVNYITNIGCNVNRGAYASALQAQRVLFDTRNLICSFFNFNNPENVVFTKNITESLNVLIKGLLKPGDHVIVSSMEHNAVMRPLTSMTERSSVEFSRVPCSIDGTLNIEDLNKYLKPNTRAVIMTHASNVCGTILPLKQVGEFCKKNDLYFIIDSAQTAGFLDLDFKALNAHAIAFTGHKALLGPQGMGGFIIHPDLVPLVDTFIEGGTGSLSSSEKQPDYMPDKFESGTMNIPGIFGLNASLNYLKTTGIDSIREKELYLTEIFVNKVKNMDNIRLIGLDGIENRTAVVSLDFTGSDNAEVSFKLSNDYSILNRCGLHCAPSAHKTLNTYPQGTVRFSFSHNNTVEEINYAVDCIYKCLK